LAVGNSTAEFTAYVEREIDKWAKVVKAANLKSK
jgi:tripartite-type tricarboxylate transporter receptor subunit TctC